MTKSERYKRNYRLVRNAFMNSELAKRAQSWSDEKLYNTLGIKVTKTTPTLKPMASKTRLPYYKRKYDKIRFALDKQGLTPEEARELVPYSNKKIKSYAKKERLLSDKFDARNKLERMDAWKDFSQANNKHMPPDFIKLARDINRGKTTSNGKQFDDFARYGYAVVYYMFTENLSREQVEGVIIKASPWDEDFYSNKMRIRGRKDTGRNRYR